MDIRLRRITLPHILFIFGFTLLALLLVMDAMVLAANITAFGDSITASEGSQTGGYPPRLLALLNNNGKPSIVANFGRTGEITPEGVSRIDSVLASFAAHFVLIMEGTNDVHTGISLETTKFNLQAMINKVKAAGAVPVLSTLTPSSKGGSPTLIPGSWNPMIVALAETNTLKLADNYAAVAPTWGALNSDGIHPNDSGYDVIANTWYTTIGPMISSSGAVESEGGGGGGCFIATAAFGSPMAKHVILLRRFRDSFLLTNTPGRQFVAAYYRFSPPVAECIARHETVRYLVRGLLYPLVALSYILLELVPAVYPAVIGCFLAALALGIRRGRTPSLSGLTS